MRRKGTGAWPTYRWTHDEAYHGRLVLVSWLAHEADPFIVQVDEVGQFQWPDGGFQEVKLAKGEWAGPIEEPNE